MDSNHRRHSRRIYSPLHLAALQPTHNLKKWSWRKESNLQPADYKSAALPLSHASTGAQRWNRTTDTGIFSPLLYRLSYLGVDYFRFHLCLEWFGIEPPTLARTKLLPLRALLLQITSAIEFLLALPKK